MVRWVERTGAYRRGQVLKGAVGVGSSPPLAGERDFRQGWCLMRPDWRAVIGKRDIWILTHDGNRYRAPDLFSGFNQMKLLQKIQGELRAAN